MRVKLSSTYKAVSGKAGSIVNFQSGGNPVARKFVNPVNKNTEFQQLIRTKLGQVSAAFRELTDEQRANWENVAIQISRNNSLGQKYSFNAKSLFVHINTYRVLFGQFMTTTPPTITVTNGISDISTLYFDGNNWNLIITAEAEVVVYMIEATPILPGLQLQPKEKQYTLITTDPVNAIVGSQGNTTLWSMNLIDVKNTYPIENGHRLGIRISILNEDYLKIGEYSKVIVTENQEPSSSTISGTIGQFVDDWINDGGQITVRNQTTGDVIQTITMEVGNPTYVTEQLPAGTYRIELNTTDFYHPVPDMIGDLGLNPPTNLTGIDFYIDEN